MENSSKGKKRGQKKLKYSDIYYTKEDLDEYSQEND